MSNRLPSLNSLRAFDAAARHLNLVRAAEEMGITQGAVSRQIQALEGLVGAPLFSRGPRGLTFTEAGDFLFAHTRPMFAELQVAMERLNGQRARQTLHVAVARSYATRVLAAHIGEFVERHPWIEVRLDGHRHLIDLTRGEADAAIRVGDGKWSGLVVESLGEEELFPVCSPELITGNPPIRDPGDLAHHVLLHYWEQPYWQLWLSDHAPTLNARRGVAFSETAMMLTAAEAGQGVAIGRTSLVRSELRSGRLARPFEHTVKDGIGYWFVCTPQAAARSTVSAFRGWLLENVAQW
jgi:LysR family glycine cleavage system transcriptional activator